MKPYLIQRASFAKRDKKGIDSILRFDYMGSSEFEWGALPESLCRIRTLISDYTYLDVPIKDKVITVFCKSLQKSDVKQYLSELSENKWHLKGYSDFNNYINSSKYSKNNTDFWWDIENDFMFWKKNIKFEQDFKKAINDQSLPK